MQLYYWFVTLILNIYVYINTITLALQGMEDYEEAMVALSQGLAANPKENAMLTALVEIMLKSSLKGIYTLLMIKIENCSYIISYYTLIDFPIDNV